MSDAEDILSWCRSVTKAWHGFCAHCGSSLFWNGGEFDPFDAAAVSHWTSRRTLLRRSGNPAMENGIVVISFHSSIFDNDAQVAVSIVCID